MPPPVSLTPQQIANFFPEMNPFLRAVLEGEFLDPGNPFQQQVIDAIRSDAQRGLEQSIIPLQRSRLGQSGAFGTALGALGEARTVQDFNRALNQQIAGTRAGFFESERDRQLQALGLFSGETTGARQGLFGARAADVGAAAQRASARIRAGATLGAAREAAGASRFATTTNARLQALRDLSNLSSQLNFFNTFGQGQFGQQQGAFGGPAAGPVRFNPGQGLGGQPLRIPDFQFQQGPGTFV